MRLRILYLHLLLVVSLARLSDAGCGSTSCPIDIYNQHRSEKGSVRLDYSYEYIDQDQPRIGRRRAAVGQIAGHHDEVATLNQTQRLGIEVGLSSLWRIQAILPFVHREHQHIHHHHGADLFDSWHFNGMGDVTLSNRLIVFRPDRTSAPTVSAIVGGVLPT